MIAHANGFGRDVLPGPKPAEPSLAALAIQSLRSHVLSVLARLTLLHDSDTPGPLRVTFERYGRKVTLSFTAEDLAGFIPAPVNPLDELHLDALAILKKLVASAEPMMGDELAAALRIPNEGGFRSHLGPRAPLRRLGLMTHQEGEGYSATDLARELLK